MTLLEILSEGGWAVVAHPNHVDDAIDAAKAHGNGFYAFHYRAFTEYLEPRGLKTKFFGISGGQVAGVNPFGWPEDHVKRYGWPELERWVRKEKEAIRVVSISEAAEEFSRKCYKILVPAALKWKLELVLDFSDAYIALHKAVPELPWKPQDLAEALTKAWVEQFGDGVILRDGGDIAIRTAKIKTTNEIRKFLQEFAVGYLSAYRSDQSPRSESG